MWVNAPTVIYYLLMRKRELLRKKGFYVKTVESEKKLRKGEKGRKLKRRNVKVKEIKNHQVRGDSHLLARIINLYVVGSD